MSLDIGPILDGWEYRLGEISARKIMGVDGLVKIQLRLDTGLLQMELHGRPDGKRPYGGASLLDYYQTLAQEHQREERAAFALTHEDCKALQMESTQYYHRRITFFQLKDYEGAKQDAVHNLQIMDLVKTYASDPQYAQDFEQFRAFVTAHRIRAESLVYLREEKTEEALRCIQEGIEEIEAFIKTSEAPGVMDGAKEIEALKSWAAEIDENRPVSEEERLQAELKEAVQKEDFERAAELRDQIRAMAVSGIRTMTQSEEEG
jgi:hypothetical protein